MEGQVHIVRERFVDYGSLVGNARTGNMYTLCYIRDTKKK